MLNPLFCEMEEIDEDLDMDEFVEAACRLYETLSQPEKNALLSFRRVQRKSLISIPKFRVSSPLHSS